jgi:methylated-DNA-[protein]-cysteine S-methyltransferase
MPYFSAICHAPFGILGIRVFAHAVSEVTILDCAGQPPDAAPDPLALETVAQLQRYLRDPTQAFDLPLYLPGSPFQQRVWQALREIPPGQAMTYGQLAARLDSGPRAVGGACRANPIAIIVPCHRVIGVKGLTGYMGKNGLAYKRWLLEHEHFYPASQAVPG